MHAHRARWAFRGAALLLLSLTAASVGLAAVSAGSAAGREEGVIAYVSARPSPRDPGFLVNDEVFFMRADGSGRQRITNNAYVDHLGEWSPDGTKLLAYRTAMPPAVGGTALNLLDAEGRFVRRLLLDRKDPSDDDLGAVDWSPDSRRIVFELDYELYSMSVRGGVRRKLTRCAPPCASGPAVAPDGRIAYVDVNADIYVMNADGTGAHRIVEVSNPWGPEWSPDGKRLLFSVSADRGSDIYVANADGTGLRKLVPTASDQGSATWSPDGRRVVYVKHVIGESRRQIFVVGVDGGKPVNVSRTQTSDGSPAWSPDGTRIAFERTLVGDDRSEIFVMAADGSDQHRLTRTYFADYGPAWQPSQRR